MRLDGGDGVEARRLLLATGLADELPEIDGQPLDGDLAEKLAANHVRVLGEPIRRFEDRDGQLERIAFGQGKPLERDAVFVATVVLHQRSDLAVRLGCALPRRLR